MPGIQLEMALHDQFNGEYERAVAAYLAVLGGNPAPHEESLARFRMAECYQLSGDYVAAATAWEEFLLRYPEDERLPEATLMAAWAYHASGNCTKAIAHYTAYVEQETALADLVYERIGDCYASQAAVPESIEAYRRAIGFTQDPSVEVSLRQKKAGAHLSLAEYDEALAEYDAILRVSRLDHYRAQIEYLAGQALMAAGQPDAAYARFRHAMDSYPTSVYGYLSLAELVEADLEVDDFQRGLVDYNAGATYPAAYTAAIEAFDRYLSNEPRPKADEALYRKALTQRALGRHDAALETLQTIILEHPNSKWLASAWFQKARTLEAMGDTDQALKAYLDVAAFFPADELAAEALWTAAELQEDSADLAGAAQLYRDLQFSFPAFEDADQALWNAGFLEYRSGALDQAVATWQSLVEKYSDSPYRARCLFWLGKLESSPESSEGNEPWDVLVASYPHNYYALRVEQIRAGDSLSSTRMITAGIAPPRFDAVEAEAEILTWLAGWTDIPTDTHTASLVRLPQTLAQHVDLRRGEALLAAGLRREALNAYGDLRAAATNDPVALAQLAFYFQDRDLPAQAASCAYRLAMLWPDGLIYDAPLSVQRLAYPLAYADLLSAQADERGLDPLLLAALVRQESYFEPLAESYAGARGLTQVMPATAAEIADNLRIDGFEQDKLFRPSVGLEFGAYYLASQLRYFDDQILVALAAYHGGPGNTIFWLDAAGGDLDLFVEVITASESRRYLQQVYLQYVTYEALYRPPDTGH